MVLLVRHCSAVIVVYLDLMNLFLEVCARPTFLLPSFLRDAGDARVIKVRDSHCIISQSLASSLNSKAGDAICICNPVITVRTLLPRLFYFYD
jgi:hypothetical protein